MGKARGLLEVLEVDAEGEVVGIALVRGKGYHIPAPHNLPLARDKEALAEYRRIRVGPESVEGDLMIRRPRRGEGVRKGVEPHFARVLGGGLELGGEGMPHLPEIVVVKRGIQSEVARIGRVPVIDLQASMEGELVFHLELHIGRAHLLTRGKDGETFRSSLRLTVARSLCTSGTYRTLPGAREGRSRRMLSLQ